MPGDYSRRVREPRAARLPSTHLPLPEDLDGPGTSRCEGLPEEVMLVDDSVLGLAILVAQAYRHAVERVP
jgi:hypothetical protein